MKQTAVEWLLDNLPYDLNLYRKHKTIIEQAKGMEKEQINDAHYDGYYQEGMADTRAYYDKKYKNKTI